MLSLTLYLCKNWFGVRVGFTFGFPFLQVNFRVLRFSRRVKLAVFASDLGLVESASSYLYLFLKTEPFIQTLMFFRIRHCDPVTD